VNFPKVVHLGNNNIGNVPVKSVQARARLGRFSGGCRRKSIDANRPDGQPVAQPNARVLQRKITSALVKRRSLQTADHLVTDPTVDGGANSRS